MRRAFLAGLMAAGIACAVAVPVVADEGDVVYPADTKPLGVSYATWAARWNNWEFATPTARNPFVHPENCSTNLHGNVWYMTQADYLAIAKTHCTIPRGTSVLLTPGLAICDSSSPTGDNGDSIHDLEACVESYLSTIYAPRVWVDGIEYGNVEPFLVRTTFRMTWPRDNFAGVRPGTYPAVTSGWYLMLRPLSPGRHTVVVRAQTEGGFGGSTAFLTVR